MPEHVTDEDLELLGELGVDAEPAASVGRTAKEQRMIAGFEEIERFVEQHGRAPEHGEDRDIFERLYAVRLDRMRESEECRDLLKDIDTHRLLAAETHAGAHTADDMPNDDELLASLAAGGSGENDVTRLVHVRAREEIKAAEEIAQRTPCNDFDAFRPVFERVQHDLDSGLRRTIKYGDYAGIKEGNLFILDGQKVIVAELGDEFVSDYGRPDRRLRVVYDNGTESDLLLRSLQRALYKDKASRRISESGFGPLFAELEEDGDMPSGYVYVLRSKSDDPYIAAHRDVIHKIGVTGGDVKTRVANARKDPTYLLADVDIVVTYKLANINRRALEALLQKFFGAARLDLELKDRFGLQVEPREWFLVPLPVIDEAIERLKDGTIGNFRYDRELARVVPG